MGKQTNTAKASSGGLSSGLKKATIPLVIAAVAGIIAILSFTGSGNSDQKATANPNEDPAAKLPAFNFPGPRPRGDNGFALGSTDAPVVMIMYSEYQCPFCGRHATQTQPDLINTYVKAGLLRIEWRDFPFLGTESFTAANAGHAAADQGAFWEYTDRLFAEQGRPNSGHFTDEYLIATAADIGLDTKRFAEVMNDPATAAAVDADRDEGVSYSVTGTPAFFINGQFVSGAQPPEVFVAAIENAASAAGVVFD